MPSSDGHSRRWKETARVEDDSLRQRHISTCPRTAEGTLEDHRCRGPWEYVIDAGRHPSRKRRRLTRGGCRHLHAATDGPGHRCQIAAQAVMCGAQNLRVQARPRGKPLRVRLRRRTGRPYARLHRGRETLVSWQAAIRQAEEHADARLWAGTAAAGLEPGPARGCDG